MKRIFAAALLSLAALPALAIQVEFQVPVELKNIDPDAIQFDVICGQFMNGAFNGERKVTVPLRDAGTHKHFSGMVTVKVDWPGTTVPRGKYRCTMAVHSKSTGYGDFQAKPAAVGTRAVTLVEGDFSEMTGLPKVAPAQAPKAATKPPLQR